MSSTLRKSLSIPTLMLYHEKLKPLQTQYEKKTHTTTVEQLKYTDQRLLKLIRHSHNTSTIL